MGRRGNGEGTIRHDTARGRWEGRVMVGVDDDGRPVRRKVTGRTRGEVVARIRELVAAADAGRTPAPRDLTVGRFLDTWLADVLPGTVARSTEANYRHVVALYIKPKLGRRRLRTLTARDVAVMAAELEADGLAPNTRRLARAVLRRALRWAEAEGFVERNVAALAPGVRIPAPDTDTLSVADARTFLAHLAGHRMEAAYSVALALGLRRGELLGLAWTDLDLDGARLTVRRALKRVGGGLVLEEPKTRTSRRTVVLPPGLVAALRRHRAAQAAERLAAGELWEPTPLGADLVFRTAIGGAIDPDNFRTLTYRLTEAAGIGRWSPHALRHAAATMLLAQGVPLKTISETLGHSSIRVTADVYAHLADEARAAAADAAEAALWT